MNKTAKIKLFIVYVHTCLINGRKYVGITSRSATRRWKKDGKGYEYAMKGHMVGLDWKIQGDRRKLNSIVGY